jgi:hypothetical protein
MGTSWLRGMRRSGTEHHDDLQRILMTVVVRREVTATPPHTAVAWRNHSGVYGALSMSLR